MSGASGRSIRDRFLGLAAAVFAAASFLAAATYALQLSLTWPEVAVTNLAGAICVVTFVLAGEAALPVGFVLSAMAFLGRRGARSTRMRRGAFVAAGACSAVFAGYVLSTTFSVISGEFPNYSDAIRGASVVQTFAILPQVVAAIVVASAFTPGDPCAAHGAGKQRNRRLGWASISLGVGFALEALSDAIVTRPFLSGLLDLFCTVQGLGRTLPVAAAVVAAIGFFTSDRVRGLPDPDHPLRREGCLTIAAGLLALSGALVTTAAVVVFLPPSRLGWWETAYIVRDSLLGARFLLTGILAALGFGFSRRSLERVAQSPTLQHLDS